jgi:membrane associated rhomboid family serine protease/Flp pilus assembly protein TadD
MLLYEENAEHRDNTPGVWLLILINVGVFIYEVTRTEPQIKAFVDEWGLIPAKVFGGFDPHVFVTGFTSMFMHGGFGHLFGNMLFLHVFGDNIENRMGMAKFLLFYLICGTFADIADVLIRHNQTIASIGASGAISGVLGAYFMLYPTANIRLWFSFLPPIVATLPAYSIIGVWFIMQVIFQFVDLNSGHVETGGIAWMAHIGGFLAGILLVQVFVPKENKIAEDSQLIEQMKKADEAKEHRRRRLSHEIVEGAPAYYQILATSLLALVLPTLILGFLSLSAITAIGTSSPLAYVEYTIGKWDASSQKYLQAKQHFDNAIGIAPKSAMLYFERGRAELGLSQYESALLDFERAGDINPNLPELGIYLGNCAYQLGRYDQSIEYYNQYIEVNPASAAALCNRGWALMQNKKYQLAMEDFNKSLQLNADLESTYCGIGACFYFLKKYDQAIDKLDYAIRMNSSDYRAYYYRGLAYADLRQYDRALQDLSTAVGLLKIAPYYLARAKVYIAMNRNAEAISDLSVAIDLKPVASTIAMRGQCYKKLGQTKLADKDFLLANQMNPKSHPAVKPNRPRKKIKSHKKARRIRTVTN